MQSDIVQEARLDAKAFRENAVYTSDGQRVKFGAVADRLDAYAAEIERNRAEIERLRDALCFIGKWVERGAFDPQISAKEAVEVIINLPGMPWNSERWDVDHKPYAAAYYAQFPTALKGPSHDAG